MTNVSFYGAVGEIGGNKIKVDMNSTSLMFDFGMSFNEVGKYYDNFVQPRKANGLGDFFELGLLPKIKGIYRHDYLKHMGLDYEDKPSIDGLLLSHAHADHADYIRYLRYDIPIFMSLNSKIIMDVIDQTGSGKELTTLKRQFEMVPKKSGDGYTQLKSPNNNVKRNIIVLEPYKKENIGDLEVQLAPVDHSLPGASGFLIEGDERVVYTGDLRFHGRCKESTYEFVKQASKFSPNVMFCEGTRINSEKHKKEKDENGEKIEYLELEEDIEAKAYPIISECKGLTVINFPLRDLDRLVTFRNVAEQTDRKLLINTKQAYMLKLIEEQNNEKTIYPSLNDEHIGIYIPRRASGYLGEESYVSYDGNWQIATDKDLMIKDYSKWERIFFEYDNFYTYRDVRDNQEDFMIRADNFSFMELIDIQPENAIYIHSTTGAFNTEMELSKKITDNWLSHFNIPQYEHFHVSGHAKGPELIEMIRDINPDVLYPIHTEEPKEFDILKEDGIKVIHPELAK